MQTTNINMTIVAIFIQDTLLETIRKLEDEDSGEDLPLSPDGRYLLLSTTDFEPSFSPTSLVPPVIKAEVGQGESAAISPDMCPDEESEA